MIFFHHTCHINTLLIWVMIHLDLYTGTAKQYQKEC